MIDEQLLEQAVERERRRTQRGRMLVALFVAALLAGAFSVLLKLLGYAGPTRLLYSLLGGGLGALLIFGALAIVSAVSARTTEAFMMPGGASRPPAVHSHAEALAAKGDLVAAAAAFEAVRATHGESAHTLRAEAEIQLAPGGDPARARDLLQRLRKAPDMTRADELYATHRLIDLYLGPLTDDGRAMVELRRLADRFPGTPDAAGALAELDRRRALLKDQYEQS
jgi:hypothetical protein